MKLPTYQSSLFSQIVGRIASKKYRRVDPFHKTRRDEIQSLMRPLDEFWMLFPEVGPEEISSYEQELETIQSQIAKIKDECGYMYSGTADLSLAWLQYMICRIVRPDSVVETGVWIGGSSFTILSAMKANHHGNLHSIDFPPFWKRKRVEIGKLVPESFYDRWDLYLGPSKDILESKFKKTSVDIFIHDSDHTYSNMMAEFEFAWDILKPSGYLISDDSSDNDSVLDFCESKGVIPRFYAREKGGTIAIIRRDSY